jgi:two-component system, NtrC family, response regulator AtoC
VVEARELGWLRLDGMTSQMLPDTDQILVVDDEANLRRVLAAQLGRDGYEVHTAPDGEAALAFLREHHVDLVITDLRMPNLGGMDLLRAALRDQPELPVIILTAHGTVDTAVEALKTGAFDYISKPFDQDEVRLVVRKALRTRALASRDASRQPAAEPEETREDAASTNRFGIIGTSRAVVDLYALIDKVAPTPSTVLVTGESGTGKELVARALHEESSRKDGPFIKVNCAAIPTTLMESELFGHEKGAFTGAVGSKPGRFELASGGTLFLDEIGEIPPEMQVKLLRVLQESEFERVGGVRTLRVHVRLVAATNRDLKKEIDLGGFREDLFYRLNVVPINLAPLRDRRDDIPDLARFFLTRFNRRLNKSISGIEEAALELLTRHRWPGNIRELENIIERAVLFADGDQITVADLPAELSEGPRGLGGPSMPVSADGQLGGEGLKEQVKAVTVQLERQIIIRALDQTSGNVTHAARLLKISRKGLQLKMKELELRERGD